MNRKTKNYLSPVLVFCLFLVPFTGVFLFGEEQSEITNKAFHIAEEAADVPDSVEQLLVIFNGKSGNDTAMLTALERAGKGWNAVFDPMPVNIGRKGFAKYGEKQEGDKKTPSGLYRLGLLFTYEKDVDTQMPYIQSTSEDKWIDDPDSDDYNRHVRGETDAKSYERLLLNSNAYKYCMVIEYNTNPVVKGMGSAIFLHLHGKSPGGTAGCVAIHEEDMKTLLGWLKPEKVPSILMGMKSER
jgi:L,D-peptidoglycan transpeptidase YkuD (ErfK/YbiS/YcfS/YnhG family)